VVTISINLLTYLRNKTCLNKQRDERDGWTARKHNAFADTVRWQRHKKGVALTGRNRTGPPCTVGRRTGHAPDPATADRPRALQTTTGDADRQWRQTTACKTILAHWAGQC